MGIQSSGARIQYLWDRWVDRSASDEEVEELFIWIRSRDGKDDLLAGLPGSSADLYSRHTLDERQKARILDDILRERQKGQSGRIRVLPASWNRYAVAAMLLVITGALGYWHYKPAPPRESSYQPVSAPAQKDIEPGRQRATLTLADESTIALDSAPMGVLARQAMTQVEKTNQGIIVYRPQEQGSQTSPVNTMTTPRGGTYQLVLSDGTKVWLNAASSITFPTSFPAGSREVSITGEAYFEVTRNPAKPFTVHTYRESLVVLGTSFNVNSYTDEFNVKASLLEGSVQIGTKQLRPGEVYLDDKVYKADVDLDIAWKNGSFAFSNADLKTVMRQLARWYDLTVIYPGKIPAGKFSGEIGRTLTLNQLLKGLATTKIKYRLENKNQLVIIPD